MSIQSDIQSRRESLAPSMRRVADAILDDPLLVVNGTITDLARRCDTSETTIVRFARVLGLAGYVELRISLATELGRETARRPDTTRHGSDVPTGGSLADIVADLGFTETLCIEETVANLDVAELGRVVDAVDTASRISLYGVSASGWTADDLQRKLFRIGRVAHSFSDSHDALVSTALLRPGDVAIGVSHRGTTAEVINFLNAAKEPGATTIAITNDGRSPLASTADLVLTTTVRESRFRSGTIGSRTAQLLLVDCIFVAVARRRRDQTVDALSSTYDAVAQYRTET